MTPAQEAESLRLRRVRRWLELGDTDQERELAVKALIAQARDRVNGLLGRALDLICKSREEAATITRLLELIGAEVPDADRRAELTALALAKRHLLSEDLVAAMLADLQDDVDAAEPGAYRELGRVPLRPNGDDPTTIKDIETALKALGVEV